MFEEIDTSKLYTTEQIIKTLTTKEYYDNYVDYKTTIKACRECPNYSKNWGCPEFDYDVLENWKKYSNIELILTKITFTDDALKTTYTTEELEYIVENSLFKEKNRLINELEKLERKKNGWYLSAGFCNICDECSRIIGQPCRFPDRCRNSIESYGGLVADTLDGVFNEKIKWIDTENGKLPENLSLLMGLLY